MRRYEREDLRDVAFAIGDAFVTFAVALVCVVALIWMVWHWILPTPSEHPTDFWQETEASQ